MEHASEVVAFWQRAGSARWFSKSRAFDTEFRDRFLDTHYAAARRELDAWAESAHGALALVLLLDQFPRNAFRGTAHMVATDSLARHFAGRAVAAKFDAEVESDLCLFFYLPFAHSERLGDQLRSLELHRRLEPEFMKHAIGHHDIVARFGRFPHRNHMLGRETTPEEQAFLDAGGFAG